MGINVVQMGCYSTVALSGSSMIDPLDLTGLIVGELGKKLQKVPIVGINVYNMGGLGQKRMRKCPKWGEMWLVQADGKSALN